MSAVVGTTYLVLGLGAVLVVSGAAKLLDRSTRSRLGEGFSLVPEPLRALAAVALAPTEVVLGVLLVVTGGAWAATVSWVVAALIGAFVALVALTLLRGERPSCHCFGASDDAPIGGWTLARNTGLLVAALAVAVGARPEGGVVPAVAALDADQGTSLAALVLATLVAVVLWVREARLARRVDQLARTTESASLLTGVTRAPAPPPHDPRPVPAGVLVDPDGVPHELAAMARDKANLLVFISPTCETCHRLAPLLPDWQHVLGAELDVTVVGLGSRRRAVSAYPVLASILWTDPDGAHDALGVPGTPSAVLLGTNGTVGAGPASGVEAIVELLGTIADAVGLNLLTGTAQQSRPREATREEQAGWVPQVGRAVPDLHVVTEDGRVTSYADALAEVAGSGPLVTVAWSAGCAHCRDIVAPVREASAAGGVVLVTSEDVSTVRAQGIRGPVLQVMPPGNAVGAVGVPGTPAAVPVRAGRVVGLGGVGGPHTLEVLAEHANPGDSWIDQLHVG